MPWKEPAERHSDLLVEAIERAAHGINHTLREGFMLLALQIAASSQATTDNSPAIEATTKRIRALIATLHQSLPTP